MRNAILLLTVGALLAACQTITPVRPQTRALNQGAQSVSRTAANHARPLAFSPTLRQALAQPDSEPNTPDGPYSDDVAEPIFDPDYIHAHSYYFDYLHNGQSSIEMILAHDGQARAAGWVRKWRKQLADGAIWPDHESTTYKGPFPALEHGEIDAEADGWFLFRSASVKAEEYFQRAVKAWKPGLSPEDPAQSEAWSWLGRSSHLIQDLSVPFHTRPLIRPSQALYHNAYEKSSARRFGSYMPVPNANYGGAWAESPYPADGTWGLYFPPGSGAGQIVTHVANQSRPFYSLVNERENPGAGNWELSRSVMVPLGAKATAGLVMSFLNKVGY